MLSIMRISNAISTDLDKINNSISNKIGVLIKDATKKEISDSLEKFDIRDIEKFLRSKKLNKLS